MECEAALHLIYMVIFFFIREATLDSYMTIEK